MATITFTGSNIIWPVRHRPERSVFRTLAAEMRPCTEPDVTPGVMVGLRDITRRDSTRQRALNLIPRDHGNA